jgi:hypothetical protein
MTAQNRERQGASRQRAKWAAPADLKPVLESLLREDRFGTIRERPHFLRTIFHIDIRREGGFAMFKACCTLLMFAVLALPAAAADSDAAQMAEVKVTIVFPASLDSFDAHSVKVILDQSVPPQPGDKPGVTISHPVDTQQVDDVSHVKGTESKLEVTVGSKVNLDPSLKYMVLAQVWAGGKSKGLAMLQNKPNVSVLTGGAPNAVTLTVMHLVK